MIGIPIIHARTYNADSRTCNLLIRPKTFNKIESDFCYRVAKDSTIFRELASDEGRTTCCTLMQAINKEKISLCTSLYTVKAIRESYFDVVTCQDADHIQADNFLLKKLNKVMLPRILRVRKISIQKTFLITAIFIGATLAILIFMLIHWFSD